MEKNKFQYGYEHLYMIKEKFWKARRMYRSAVDSFNDFVDNGLVNLIEQRNPIIIKYANNYYLEMNIRLDYVESKPKTYVDNKNIPLYPNVARTFDLNYTAPVYVKGDLKLYSEDSRGNKTHIKSFDINSFKLFDLPIVVGSKICHTHGLHPKYLRKIEEDPNDIYGYFIIGGNEYFVINQEHKGNNMIFINKDDRNDGEYICFIQSKPYRKYDYPYKIHITLHNNDLITIAFTVSGKPDKTKALPISLAFRILGVTSDREIFDYILGGNTDPILITALKNALYAEESMKFKKTVSKAGDTITTEEEVSIITDTQDSINKAAKIMGLNPKPSEKRPELVREIINNRFFPHLMNDIEKKKSFLGYMVNLVLKVKYGYISLDNQQDYGNRRVIGVKTELIFLLRNIYKSLMKKVVTKVSGIKMTKGLHRGPTVEVNPGVVDDKYIDNIITTIKTSHNLSKTFSTSISKGSWPRTGAGTNREGITGIRENKSMVDNVGQVNKVITSVSANKKTKSTVLNQYDTTQTGAIGINETTDSEKIGILKELAMGYEVSMEHGHKDVYEVLEKCPHVIELSKVNIKTLDSKLKIFVNGLWDYCSDKCNEVRDYLVEKRRNGFIDKHTEISLDYHRREIRIFTDEGRVLTPMFIVDQPGNKLRMDELDKKTLESMTWDELCTRKNGRGPYVEYISLHELKHNVWCADSIETLRVADKNLSVYTHCLIDPSFNIGYSGNSMPLQNHNPAPRIVYADKHAKQTVGFPTTQFRKRMYQTLNVAESVETPLVMSMDGQFMGLMDYAPGNNFMVAIATHGGYNIEDAIIYNQDSAHAGLGTMYKYSVYKTKKEIADEIMTLPNHKNTFKYKTNKYGAIGKNGLPIIGKTINEDDVIIGKIKPIDNKDYKYIDSSVIFHGDNGSVIDYIPPEMQKNIPSVIKVRVRKRRVPNVGDKYCSRHAQKGTIACLIPKEEMPYTATGMVPDIIINPHSIPSRMTIGQLIEAAISKAAGWKGKYVYASSFSNPDIKEYTKELKELGFDEYGNEEMYDPRTGDKMDVKIFFCPTFYQRLKQMVNDKIFIRQDGKVDVVYSQPRQGKTGGGLKVGHMEGDGFMAWGASSLLNEVMVDKSDEYYCGLCTNCGMIPAYNENNNYKYCHYCKSSKYIRKMRINFTTKTFIQLIAGTNVMIKFKPNNPDIQ